VGFWTANLDIWHEDRVHLNDRGTKRLCISMSNAIGKALRKLESSVPESPAPAELTELSVVDVCADFM
jgi:hypothetical protein